MEFSSPNKVLRGLRIKGRSSTGCAVACLAVVNKFLTYGGFRKKYEYWKGKRNLESGKRGGTCCKTIVENEPYWLSAVLFGILNTLAAFSKSILVLCHTGSKEGIFTASLIVQNK